MAVTETQLDEEVRAIVETLSRRLIEQGARATFLTGSQARGQASPHSDIDLFAIGAGPKGWFAVQGERLVGVYWWTAQEARERMYRPETALLSVLAWRDALPIDDPSGIGAEIQREAREWSWRKIDKEADVWVADKLMVWAEYVHKIAKALEEGRELDACAIRSDLALRMAEAMAVHKRVSAQSENGLWETIAEAGGPEWRQAQERAFAKNGDDWRTSAGAALTLFALAAEEADELFDEREREVIRYALRVAAPWRS